MKRKLAIEEYNIVLLFSGQGSQYRGMGSSLFHKHPIFTASIEKSDAIFQKQLGRSLIDELYGTDKKKMDELIISHPAIVAVEIAMLNVLKEKKIPFDYAVGSSLGEFAAATACGIWTDSSAMECVIEQAKSISQTGTEGGMLTILKSTSEQVHKLVEKNSVYLVSENFPGHFTVSGKKKNLDNFQDQLDDLKIPYLRLPVAYPFHSPLIESGKTEFFHFMQTNFQPFQAENGFVSGLHAKEMKNIPEDYFWQIIREPINFIPVVNYLESKGPCLYIDLGPSGTSANFVKYNLPENSKSITHQILTPYKKEQIKLAALYEFFEVNH